MKILTFTIALIISFSSFSQENRVSFSVYDGFVVAGYVDRGVFLNFTGPNVNLIHNNSKYVIGMLPSLRFKRDTAIPKNSFVTPNLGIGFTYSYKKIAFQLPFYYNAKTLTSDGKWHIGIGLGVRLGVE